MARRVEFGVTVDRWVRLRQSDEAADPPFVLDEQGFLASRADQPDRLIRTTAAAATGGWVLLGEPGAGKTTTFKSALGQDLPDTVPFPGEAGVVWVDGSDLGDAAWAEELIGAHLDALPANTDTGSGPAAGLTVVIDQLDESPFILRLAQWLRRCLARRDVRNLRVWVACRTAEYPAGLTKVLEDSLGSCTVGDLAPLTHDDIVELVTSAGEDAAVFLDAVLASAVGVLASIPLTLKVLLSAYREDPDSLREEPRRIFELGMIALADEIGRAHV